MSQAEKVNKHGLSVLPPLVLLDFGNGSRSTVDLDPKSKRTIDSSLGYGHPRSANDDQFAAKYREYFLSTKSVPPKMTFEDSIVVAPPIPSTEKPATEELLPTPLPLMRNKDPLPVYPPYSTYYGQRLRTQPNYYYSTRYADDQYQDQQPKYTIENGIKYETKWVWKYPDGRTVPVSYINNHSEYQEEQTTESYQPDLTNYYTAKNNYQTANHKLTYLGDHLEAQSRKNSELIKYRSTPPQMQQYVNKAKFTASQPYDLTDLLSYYPSISQYVKNPATILKAKPTFVQAGENLIPVVILRVDGDAPAPLPSQDNVNLKAALQQYLTQYAVNTQAQYGAKRSSSQIYKQPRFKNDNQIPETSVLSVQSAQSPIQNPAQDLKLFTEALATLRQLSMNYKQQQQQPIPQKPGMQVMPNMATSYAGVVKDYRRKMVPIAKRPMIPQKIKNLQIIEDPNYTSYKIEN